MRKLNTMCGFAVAVLAIPALAWSQKTAEQTKPAAVADKQAAENKDAGDIAALIQDLGSDKYQTRADATEALLKAGVPATAALEKAADSDDLEMPNRCVAILRRMLQGDDKAASEAARKSLETLAKSDRKYLANRAQLALKAPQAAAPVVRPLGGGVQIRINGQNIAAGKNFRMQQNNNNGVRETTVEIDDRKIVINDTNDADITVQVTETVQDDAGNPKVETKKYTAKDYETLKKDHPAAAEYYDKYVKNNGVNGIRVLGRGGIRIQMAPGGRVLPRRVLPAVPRAVPGAKPNPAGKNANERAAERIRASQESLRKHLERLEEQAAAGRIPAETVDRMRQSIEKTLKRMDDQAEALE